MTTSNKPMTVPLFRNSKQSGNRLTMVTTYDYTSARIADSSGVDALLVGDSMGMVIQGHKTSIPVTMEQIIYHTACVARGVERALIVADMPFDSYHVSTNQAVENACRLLKAGAHAVKLEGGARMRDAIEAIVAADIPVMGHIGLTPQSVHRMGGFKVQRDTEMILADARAVEAAGAFSMVIEGVPAELGARVTREVSIPTIGIGAGPTCDGQILVWHDLMGLYDAFRPKFVKVYAELGNMAKQALTEYCKEVREGTFPTAAHSFQ